MSCCKYSLLPRLFVDVHLTPLPLLLSLLATTGRGNIRIRLEIHPKGCIPVSFPLRGSLPVAEFLSHQLPLANQQYKLRGWVIYITHATSQ